jgi:hypothetical protein
LLISACVVSSDFAFFLRLCGGALPHTLAISPPSSAVPPHSFLGKVGPGPDYSVCAGQGVCFGWALHPALALEVRLSSENRDGPAALCGKGHCPAQMRQSHWHLAGATALLRPGQTPQVAVPHVEDDRPKPWSRGGRGSPRRRHWRVGAATVATRLAA